MAGASKRERKKTNPKLALWWRQLKWDSQTNKGGCCRNSGQGATAGTWLRGLSPFVFGVVGSQCLGGKACDGIYRRMAEHKVYVCLKTSVKSISGLRGKRRRKTKNREKLSSRILDLLDPRFLRDLHRCRCSLPARQGWRDWESISHPFGQDSTCQNTSESSGNLKFAGSPIPDPINIKATTQTTLSIKARSQKTS